MALIHRTSFQVRPAHTSGSTFLDYTSDGKNLITVGTNNTIRVFQTGSTEEPVNIDYCQDSNTSVVATNDFFIAGSEDGCVSKYSLQTRSLEDILTRCTLPIREVALSPDAQWVAIASEEVTVKVINTNDLTRVFFLREQTKPAKHVSFDHSGTLLAVSCSDGSIYVYSMDLEEPSLVERIDNVIQPLEPDQQISSKVLWYPDDQAFAAPSRHCNIQIVSRHGLLIRKSTDDGHFGHITAMAWSPNGACLITAASDMTICFWITTSLHVIHRIENIRATVCAFAWHPSENIVSYTNNEGELFICTELLPQEHLPILRKELQPIHPQKDPSGEISTTARLLLNGDEKAEQPKSRRERTPDSLNEILRADELSDIDSDFVDDDDGIGYAERLNAHGKRSLASATQDWSIPKRRIMSNAYFPQPHRAFQPGSTPWRDNRRYLCINLVGFVWAVKHGDRSTITVEFFDRDVHRSFHFTSSIEYDKACLSKNGTLLSSGSRDGQSASIFYRPHEPWTTRSEWRTALKESESITAIALSDSYIIVTTTSNYTRIYTLFGVPVRIYRHKNGPIVTCTTWRDYILTVANGSNSLVGTTQLVYRLENIKQDEVYQSEDVVALQSNSKLQNIFFSDTGDPCIYDSGGVLLVLEHWRTPSQARWVPLLDTNELKRLNSGHKQEQYWPVAVARRKFYCIILKGGDQYPYFPRPLLSEFDFSIPLGFREDNSTQTSGHNTDKRRLEESYLRTSIMHSLRSALVSSTKTTQCQKAELGAIALEIDKLLLQLLAAECVEGEEQGMKALELLNLMHDRSGRMIDAASKIAARFGRQVLEEKIGELAEQKVTGLGKSQNDNSEIGLSKHPFV